MIDKVKADRIINAMKQNGIEQFILAEPSSIAYLTGKLIDSYERMMALYIDVSGTMKFVVSKIYPQEDFGCEVVYFDDTDEPVEILSSFMRKSENTGVDKSWPARFLLPLMAKGLSKEYVNASFIVDEIRQIKSSEEQQKMREASAINDKAMEMLIPLIAKGLNEAQLSERLIKIYEELGAEGVSFTPIIAFGDNAADPHHVTDESCGKQGDCVVIDIGCKKNGYCSDMTRTVFIGQPSEEARKIYEIVKEANLRGIAAVRPGARFCDIDEAARSYITSMGYGEYFTHRLGHSIGTDEHEWGDVSSANTAEVKPGMCFSIEPGIYLKGTAGVRVEDLIIVTENGCEVINHFSKELICL